MPLVLCRACLRSGIKQLFNQSFIATTRARTTRVKDMPLDPVALVAAVSDFYSTGDKAKRQHLNDELHKFKTDFPVEETIGACFILLQHTQPPNVQYFGASSMYEVIRQRWEDCIANEALSSQLKDFLVNNLTNHASTQMQSITNKLSASLALLALYSIPDVWSHPVGELTNIWAATPELLLRVLAEIAAEFANVRMPLTQRSILKTELHRVSDDIIRIVQAVLASNPSPSCLNATVECVEQWLRLPGTSLDQWTPLLSMIFSAVSEDNSSLTSLLNILATNDELAHLEQLVTDIAQYISQVISKKIISELSDDSIDCEDTIGLVAAVCTILEKSVTVLIKHAKSGERGEEVMKGVCGFLLQVSSWPGIFAVDEAVSDLPAGFFQMLREELHEGLDGSLHDNTRKLSAMVTNCYAALLQNGVGKMAYPKKEVYDAMDKEQREQFRSYRLSRSTLSYDAYCIAGSPALHFLNDALEDAYNNGDLSKIESCLYLWEGVADYLTEADYISICSVLELCDKLPSTGEGREMDLMNRTLMRLLYALSHLISDHDRAVDLETVCMRKTLPNLARPRVCDEALKTLDKFVRERSQALTVVGDEVSHCCYQFFMDDTRPSRLRLFALKCIGYILSTRPPNTVMEILGNILAPHVSDLEGATIVDEEKRKFQIAIFSCLFTSLRNKTAHPGDPPVVLILRQTMPVLQSIIANPTTSSAVTDQVLEAVRCALCALDGAQVAEFFPQFCAIVDVSMERNPGNACDLTKQIVLAFGSNTPCASSLLEWLANWVEHFANAFPNGDADEWISVVYQILKKEWKFLRKNFDKSMKLIEHSIRLATKCLTSADPNVAKLSAQCLSTISNQAHSFGDEAPKQALASNAHELISIVFGRMQSDLTRQTVESLSEVLFFFVNNYGLETREFLKTLEYGDSPLVAALFREAGSLRNFKKMASRLNMAARKDKKN